MAPRLSLVLFFLLALPLAADHAITPRLIAPAAKLPLRDATSITFGGSTVLVTWDERFSPFYPEAGNAIVARLFRKDGTPLRDVQLPIAPFGITPRAVWNGSEYLIAYALPTSRFDTFPHPAIGLTRLREDGSIVSSHTIGSTIGSPELTAFAIAGDRAIVVINQIGIFLLDRDGNLVATKTAGVPIQSLIAYGDAFEAATTEVAVRPLSRDGVLGDATPIAPPSQAVIAANGKQIEVVWRTANSVYATNVGGAQTLLSADAVTKITSLTWAGDAWLTAWMTPSGVCTARFTDGGVPDMQCVTGNFEHDPFVASDGTTTLFSWADGRQDSGAANKVFVTFSTPARALLASAAAQMQFLLAADESNGGLDVAWSEANQVHLGRFAIDGAMQSDRVLGSGSSIGSLRLANGLAVWASGADIYVLRIHETAPDVIVGNGSDPRVAFDGRQWLVVWQSTDVAHTQILGSTVTQNGDFTSAAPIEPNGSRQFSPQVAANGNRFVVSWLEQPPSGDLFEGMTARLVDESGRVISNRVEFKQPAEGINGVQSIPSSLACGGSYCAVTWSNRAAFFLRDLSYGGPVVVLYTADSNFARYLGDELWAFDGLRDNNVVEQTFDPFGDLLGLRVLIAAPASYVVLPDAIVFARPTTSDELFGGSRRLFIAAAPAVRRRVARH